MNLDPVAGIVHDRDDRDGGLDPHGDWPEQG
jgi:hypothetical protein